MKKCLLMVFALLLAVLISCKKSSNNPEPSTSNQTGSLVTTMAGSGTAGSSNGIGTAASFDNPVGLAVDDSGNVYVADNVNNIIRKITSAGVVTTLAGSAGNVGAINDTGFTASFNSPWGLAIDGSRNVYVADSYNNLIRKITPSGIVSTLAGSGKSGNANNSTDTLASFNIPRGVAVDASGNIYVADAGNNLIRKIAHSGGVSTLAGSGSIGSANGTGTVASFNNPIGIAVDASGNVYVADAYNNLIRKITPAGLVTTLAGSGNAGAINGIGTAASFSHPVALALDASENVYVADLQNNFIRKITSTGTVSTFAGPGLTTGTAVTLNNPGGITLDTSGNVYIADTFDQIIRKIKN
jgi:sugar lactone lactonase YvrE